MGLVLAVPKTIRIRGRAWRIFVAPNFRGSRVPNPSQSMFGARGVTYPKFREIHLASMGRRQTTETLIHELLHACSRDKVPVCHEEAFITDVERPFSAALAQMEWML